MSNLENPGWQNPLPGAVRARGFGGVAEESRPQTAPQPVASFAPPTVAAPVERKPASIDELLSLLLDVDGSDLHLAVGTKPVVRVKGVLDRLDDYCTLTHNINKELIYPMLDERQRLEFEDQWELDLAYTIPGRSRFRVNVFRQRGSIGCVIRVIPFRIPAFETLGVPASVRRLTDLARGLVLVTGPTGSGKSTTLAALLDVINQTKAVHILSCEDPIEFLHSHAMAVVNQREVGRDTQSFASGLKRAMREDPDVILVGELRDLETIQMALTAAETGHLVFATLHTQSAPQTVDRMVDVFPPEQQDQVRTMLASTLKAVVTQQLLPTADGKGRALAAEVMISTPAIRNLIRERKGFQIISQMQAGSQYGMVTMDQSLAQLVRAGTITSQTALERAADPENLRSLLGVRR